MSETRRLGRGLEALLGPTAKESGERPGNPQELPVAAIRPNPFQPRTHFDETALKELADSIAASGLIQPVVVRPRAGGFELIAGERRWRAVQRLGWEKVPAIVREADDRTVLTLALIENLQRDDLSPMEAARSYQRLIDEFGISQAEVARLVGRDRSTVTNSLRLFKLPEEVRDMVDDGRLSEGHARALLGLTDPAALLALARAAIAAGWSVRDVENRVRGDKPASKPRQLSAAARAAAPAAKRVEEALRKHLGTDVRIALRRRGRGNLTVSFYSNDDLARLLERILGRPFEG
ncbi:MAG TPA: ParB/RepB/Spo0J family partition protein [Gemmatimonadales bacterium]|nr:ParB/RepB/Spo0J family partition protein [Gemmatimonadales bacterium]